MRILLGDLIARIHHQYHHIGVFNRLHGFNHGKLFNRFVYLAATAHTSRIYDGVLPAIPLKIDVDAVARGTRLIKRNYPFFAQDCIHQR